MEATARRSSGRFPSFASLAFLGFLCFFLFLSPVDRGSSLGHLHRRNTLIYGRQEAEPIPESESVLPSSTLPVEESSSLSTIPSSSIVPSSSTDIPSSSITPSSSSPSPSSLTFSESEPPSSVSSPSPSSSPSSSSSSAPSTSSPPESSTSESLSASAASSSTISSSQSPMRTQAQTTLIVTDNLLRSTRPVAPTPTAPDDENDQEETSPADQVGAASKGFWGNKGAVAATFTIVSLLAIGIAALLIIPYLKRRSRARELRLHRELFGEKHGDSGFSPSPSGSVHETSSNGASRPDVVYDDSRFRGATVTSAYPFAGSSNAISSQQQPSQEQNNVAPSSYKPPNSAHSHTSGQTAYWTPNASQQSLSTQQHHGSTAVASSSHGNQYMLPSQAQAQAQAQAQVQTAVDAVNYAAAAANTNYYGLTSYDTANYATNQATHYNYNYPAQNGYYDPATYAGATYDTSNYNAHYTTSTTAAPSSQPTTTATSAPSAFKNPVVRESYDSFFGYNNGAQPQPSAGQVA